MTFYSTYDPAQIPSGVAEENLVAAFWDGNAWVELEGVVNAANNTITFSTTHFTAFSVIAHSAPAAFSVSDISVSPTQVKVGGKVTISATVTNTGDIAGTYAATLKLDGTVIETKKLDLKGHASEKVTFTVTRNAGGTYIVGLGGVSNSFTVTGPAAPSAPAKPAAPKPAPAAAAAPVPWLMIGGIVVGLIVFGIAFWFISKRVGIS
ncbi:CARDB domain-containing protein [Chloroflexota bacterium]